MARCVHTPGPARYTAQPDHHGEPPPRCCVRACCVYWYVACGAAWRGMHVGAAGAGAAHDAGAGAGAGAAHCTGAGAGGGAHASHAQLKHLPLQPRSLGLQQPPYVSGTFPLWHTPCDSGMRRGGVSTVVQRMRRKRHRAAHAHRSPCPC